MKKLLTHFPYCGGKLCNGTNSSTSPIHAPSTVVSHQKPGTLRLHAYTSYAFDDKVDNYNSATDYVAGNHQGWI